MNEDKMRKEFEAELGRHLGYKQDGRGFATNKDGTYVQFSVNQHWELWQAATRAAVPAWQPIETAPKDGTVVLARIPDHDVQQAVMWSAKDQCWVIQWDHWNLRGLDAPTHWMHLPEVE